MTGSNLRILVAVGLLLALGSGAELRHSHLDSGAADGAAAEVEQARLEPTVSVDDSDCPACVLQRLPSESGGTGAAALDKPGATGTIAAVLDPLVAEAPPSAGSPRGPPPSA